MWALPWLQSPQLGVRILLSLNMQPCFPFGQVHRQPEQLAQHGVPVWQHDVLRSCLARGGHARRGTACVHPGSGGRDTAAASQQRWDGGRNSGLACVPGGADTAAACAATQTAPPERAHFINGSFPSPLAASIVLFCAASVCGVGSRRAMLQGKLYCLAEKGMWCTAVEGVTAAREPAWQGRA